MKKYHEWGYQFNESGRIEDLTSRQKRMIALAERAEAYVKDQQSNQQPGGTRSGLENRQSKRERIEAAKRKYATGDGGG